MSDKSQQGLLNHPQYEEHPLPSGLTPSALIDHMPGLAGVLAPDGSVLHLNRELREYFGRTQEELANWDSNGIIHPDDLPHLTAAFGAAIVAGKPYDIEQRMRRFDGEYRWLSNRGLPLHDEGGRLVGWQVLLTDIHDRREAEAALADRAKNLRLIIDTIPVLVWSARPDGAAEFFNQHYLDYVGRSPADLIEWQWIDHVHPDDFEAVLATWEACRSSGRSGQIEARLMRHDGIFRWFHFQSSPLHDEQGNVVQWYGVKTDIEDRKRAEQDLALREHKLREAHDHLSQAQRLSRTGSFTTDVKADIHRWSDELYNILDHPRDEPPTFIAFRDRIHPDDLEVFNAGFARSMANNSEFDEVFRIVTPSGAIKHLHAIAHFIPDNPDSPVVVGSIQDITERKLVEEELRRSEYLLTTSERISQTGSFVWDVDADEVIFSEQMRQIYEFPSDFGLVRPDLRSYCHPDDLPMVDEKIARVFRGEGYPENEERLLMPDGRIKFLSTSYRVVTHEDGRRECYGVAQDVTRRRLAENSVESLRSELAHITRVSSLGELAASIAHEVNQPLSGIITNASACLRLLAADPPDVEGAANTANRTIRDGNRAAEVLKRLRGLFARKDFKAEPFNLNDATEEVVAICHHDLQRRRIALRINLDRSLPEVLGDRIQLQQVILNLILNAADAIDVADKLQRQIVIETVNSDRGNAQLAVRDTGCGIAAEDRSRVFASFYTTKPHGMGIGLSVSKSILERHGGKLWVDSNEGPGASFCFSVPCARPDDAPSTLVETGTDSGSEGQRPRLQG